MEYYIDAIKSEIKDAERKYKRYGGRRKLRKLTRLQNELKEAQKELTELTGKEFPILV